MFCVGDPASDVGQNESASWVSVPGRRARHPCHRQVCQRLRQGHSSNGRFGSVGYLQDFLCSEARSVARLWCKCQVSGSSLTRRLCCHFCSWELPCEEFAVGCLQSLAAASRVPLSDFPRQTKSQVCIGASTTGILRVMFKGQILETLCRRGTDWLLHPNSGQRAARGCRQVFAQQSNCDMREVGAVLEARQPRDIIQI